MQKQILTKRRHQGRAFSASEVVPQSAQFVSVWVNLAPAEQSDPNLELVLTVTSSHDGGQSWKTEAGVAWRGGPGVSRPGVSLDAAALRGKRISAVVDVSRELQVEVVFSPDEELPDIS